MQNRKILSLEEVLKLDRRPTLQEMVDLSIEDYTKYLYHKGIIKYIPEECNAMYYMEDDYDPNDDVIYSLIHEIENSSLSESCDYWDKPDTFILNESEEWNAPDKERGILYLKNGYSVEYTYRKDDNWVSIYPKNKYGKYLTPEYGFFYF
ncbi:MAG: hypothetical protein FWC41_04445 [Firmicutes bacterium]|nr:hypothetical protein [Bacillota bacterium]